MTGGSAFYTSPRTPVCDRGFAAVLQSDRFGTHSPLVLRAARSNYCGWFRQLRENVQSLFRVSSVAVRRTWTAALANPSPSHPAQTVAALPGAENPLDPATPPMDGLVVGGEPGEGFSYALAPHAGGDDTRDPALGTGCRTEMVASVGGVGEYFARIVRYPARNAFKCGLLHPWPPFMDAVKGALGFA
jgi:hypothetical protein